MSLSIFSKKFTITDVRCFANTVIENCKFLRLPCWFCLRREFGKYPDGVMFLSNFTRMGQMIMHQKTRQPRGERGTLRQPASYLNFHWWCTGAYMLVQMLHKQGARVHCITNECLIAWSEAKDRSIFVYICPHNTWMEVQKLNVCYLSKHSTVRIWVHEVNA